MTVYGCGRWLGLVVCAAACFSAAACRVEEAKPRAHTHVEWGGWTFDWEVRSREGLVLTKVYYQNKKVLKFAGVCEVFVPYSPGSPRIEDLVQHPLGDSMIPLVKGSDCLPGGTCKSFDRRGHLEDKKPVVMLHEEDQSLIYLGKDEKGGHVRGHGKMLVLWSAHELGDYTYFVQWRFRDDGVLMPQVGLTGKLAHFGGDKTTGAVVGAKDRALSHVHNIFFCLDLDVDGTRNSVEEFEYRPVLPSREKATTHWKTLLKETTRDLDPASFRSWRVVNHRSKNKLGQPRSYELVPGGTGIYRGMNYARRKVEDAETFAHADLWVTRYRSSEVPLAKPLKESLPLMLSDEAVENEDVVLWYMMSMHHQPRSEDWPAMPVDWHGFRLVPRDFLDGSPVEVKK